MTTVSEMLCWFPRLLNAVAVIVYVPEPGYACSSGKTISSLLPSPQFQVALVICVPNFTAVTDPLISTVPSRLDSTILMLNRATPSGTPATTLDTVNPPGSTSPDSADPWRITALFNEPALLDTVSLAAGVCSF